MSETATDVGPGPVPVDVEPVEPVDVEPGNRAERRARNRAVQDAMATCLDHGRTAVKRCFDPAVTADDIATRLYMNCATKGVIPTLTAAKRIVADVNVEYTARSAREVKVIAGEGNRKGRRRRVSRAVIHAHAKQIARQIVDRGSVLTSPVDGPGEGLCHVVSDASYWFGREPLPVVLPPMLARMAHSETGKGPRSTVHDMTRYLSVQPYRVDRRPAREHGPRIPVDVRPTFGPAVKFSTVVQAILADGTVTRPDVDTARWSTGERLRIERENTVAVPRFPNRADGPVTAETTARHQINHGADKGPVRLQREPQLTRLLDKRNLYAPRAGSDDRELSADIPRDMRPDVDGIYYRNLLLGFLTYRPVTGGRGSLETLSRALQASRTTVGLLATEYVRADGYSAGNSRAGKNRTATVPAAPRFYPSAVLRALELSTGSTLQTALSVLLQDACRYAERVADELSLPVTARHGFELNGPARYGPTTTGPATGNLPFRPTGPVGAILSADRFNRYAPNDNVPLPTVEPGRPARKVTTYRARHVELIDRRAGARSAEWFRFWSSYGPAESVDLSSPAAATWFATWYATGRTDRLKNPGKLPRGMFPLEPLTGPVVSPAVAGSLDVYVPGREPVDVEPVERAARRVSAAIPARPVDIRFLFTEGFKRGRQDATQPDKDGNRWVDRARYRGPVPRLPEGTEYVPYVGWVV